MLKSLKTSFYPLGTSGDAKIMLKSLKTSFYPLGTSGDAKIMLTRRLLFFLLSFLSLCLWEL